MLHQPTMEWKNMKGKHGQTVHCWPWREVSAGGDFRLKHDSKLKLVDSASQISAVPGSPPHDHGWAVLLTCFRANTRFAIFARKRYNMIIYDIIKAYKAILIQDCPDSHSKMARKHHAAMCLTQGVFCANERTLPQWRKGVMHLESVLPAEPGLFVWQISNLGMFRLLWIRLAAKS